MARKGSRTSSASSTLTGQARSSICPASHRVRITGLVGAPDALGHRPLLAERVELLEETGERLADDRVRSIGRAVVLLFRRPRRRRPVVSAGVGWLHQSCGGEVRIVAAVEVSGQVRAAVDLAGAFVGVRQPWMPRPPADVVTAARLHVHVAEIRQLDTVPASWIEEASR